MSHYTYLGDSGLQISRVIVGCMSFGSKKWNEWVIEDEDKIFEILKHCYDKGIRTFDTADSYSNGESERLLGKFLKVYNIPRESVVIFSKVFFPLGDNEKGFNYTTRAQFPQHELINRQGLSRKYIIDGVRSSVERLGTYIDLLQIHRLDPNVPPKEIMRALNNLVESNQVRYLGASTMKTWQFVNLQNLAEQNGWHKFISMQNYYNLLYREEEREMNDYCKHNGVGLIPWSPNARGILTRPLKTLTTRATTDAAIKMVGLNSLSPESEEIINRVEKLASKKNVSMAVISTAWVLHKGCNPIIGFSKPSRVDEALEALDLELLPEDIQFLEEPYRANNDLFG
ncbi:hypothetical protein LJB42_004557 [Komagataella kurtzmanii]|nr:hypothetical protein LJB42_004557 [Komagataella kurtzmanii]